MLEIRIAHGYAQSACATGKRILHHEGRSERSPSSWSLWKSSRSWGDQLRELIRYSRGRLKKAEVTSIAILLTAVWSRGVDAGSDTGLRSIVDSAGLDWTQASILGDESWKKIAEENRQKWMTLLWECPVSHRRNGHLGTG